MAKVLYVEKVDYDWDSNTPVGVYLDVDFGKKEIERLNKPHNEYRDMVFQCKTCDGTFLSKDNCNRASIKTDRNGEYCENNIYYKDGLEKIMHYVGIEMDVLE